MKKLLMTLSIFAVTMTYGSNQNSVFSKEHLSQATKDKESYSHMSTEQLQKEVERRSINGELSFNMGMELIKRWSNS